MALFCIHSFYFTVSDEDFDERDEQIPDISSDLNDEQLSKLQDWGSTGSDFSDEDPPWFPPVVKRLNVDIQNKTSDISCYTVLKNVTPDIEKRAVQPPEGDSNCVTEPIGLPDIKMFAIFMFSTSSSVPISDKPLLAETKKVT